MLGASSSYVLFDEGSGSSYPRALRTVPTTGGAAVTLSSVFQHDDDARLVGSLVSADGYDDANNVSTIDYEHADGTSLGSVDVPGGYHSIYSAGSADGGYVWSRNAGDKTLEIGDLTTSGSVTDLATLPGSAHRKIRVAASDESGLLVAYQDANCDALAEDVVFVPAVRGTATTLLHPSTCTAQYTADGSVDLGGGEAVWDWYDAATETQLVDYASTSGGTVHSLTPPDDLAWWWPKMSSSQLAFVDGDDTLRTYPVAGGAPTTSTYPAHYNSGFVSTGSSFAFVEFDGPSDAGVYTTSSAASAPTKIFTDGLDPLAATAVYAAPGQVGYSDNATPTDPVFTRSLTNTGGTLAAGPESLVASSSTGFGISLSGTRALYPDYTTGSGNGLVLRAGNGSTTVLSSLPSAPDYDSIATYSDQLSGRRVLYPTDDSNGRAFDIYNDVTGTFSPLAPTGFVTPNIWGNYAAWLDGSGRVQREDLSTGQTTTIHQISVPVGDSVFGDVALWGNTVAWSVCLSPSGGGPCTASDGYLTVAPGSTPGSPTSFSGEPGTQLALSSGYLLYQTELGSAVIAHPLAGGTDTEVTDALCGQEPYSVDGSTAAWLECASVDDGSGAPEAAPLPHVANPPWFLGDPQAPTTYNTGAGTWDSDLVTSAALTSCNVVISLAGTMVRNLPCEATNMALGEATASWDGKDASAATVSPGIYTWTLAASNADGSLRNYDGSGTPVTGTIGVDLTVPGLPTGVTAAAGSQQALVSWSPPSSNGGTPITGYDVEYSANGGSSWTSASTAFHTSAATTETVSGLANGTAYVFRVAAINAIGTGGYSAASASATPAPSTTAPGAPTGVTASAGNAQAVVSWTAPSGDGASAITGYTVQDSSNGGTSWNAATLLAHSASGHDAPSTTKTVTGLTNGTAYVFRVGAVNASGVGAYSAPSAPVTPRSDSSLLAIESARSVHAGHHIHIHATLSDGIAPIEPATLTLLDRHGSTGTWQSDGTTVTDVEGNAEMTVTPARNTSYRWTFAGDSTHLAANSPVRTVAVHQVVTAHIARHSVSPGTTIQIYGTVSPHAIGRVVYLQRHSHGRWHSTAVHATVKHRALPDGTRKAGYLLSVTVHKNGHDSYRVNRPATGRNAAGKSRTVTVHVT
jgi:hypothetical protein